MTMPLNDNERRRFSRIQLDATVNFIDNECTWSNELIDISLKGALIKMPKEWKGKAGDSYILNVQLDAETCIGMNAIVAHIDEHTIGFECTVIDIASIAHLRRIVELNLGNTNLLERELRALICDDE